MQLLNWNSKKTRSHNEACQRVRPVEEINMAWRPTEQLIKGELDNTIPGKVTGWMRFAGMKDAVRFNLDGDFHRDIRRTKILLHGNAVSEDCSNMSGFAPIQVGSVGDMTAGLSPQDYVDYPYIEWYSTVNGRVVIELEPEQIEIIGKPLSAEKQKPVSREKQGANMMDFMVGVAETVQHKTKERKNEKN